MEDNFRAKVPTSYLIDLIKNVALSLVITLLILLIAALVLCFTDFPEKYTLPSAIAGTILGVFAGSSLAAKKNPGKSLISGLLTAFIYTVAAYIIGCILQGKVSFTINTALFGAISLLTGAIASILATQKKNTKKYNSGSSGLIDRLKSKNSSKKYSFKSGRL